MTTTKKQGFRVRRNALLAAVCFVLFEGTFWAAGWQLWQGHWQSIGAVLVSVLCFALFITYTAKEVRNEN